MADFYPVLTRAIASLANNSPETRAAIYERARTALVGRLRGMAPPLPEAEIAREIEALVQAAARVEAEQIGVTPFPAAPLAPTPEPPAPPAAEPQPAASPPPVLRPRLAGPVSTSDNGERRRTMIVGGAVGAMVALIAGLAYYVNSGEPTPQQRTASQDAPAAPRTDQGGKLSERVGGEATPASPGTRTDLPVAQRAVLYVETPEDPQKPQVSGGRVSWRLDSESVGQGRPVETVVRATVEIPESGLTLVFTIRRNADPTFPASHILGMRFARTGDAPDGAVKEAGVPQLKGEEGERGAPLSAITSSLGDNFFVCALSNVPIEVDRNIDLMTKRNWIDIPVRFASGKRGIVAFEKGFSGDQTITDAFNRWR